MPDMTPLESLVHAELARAGEGGESLAITRSWRAMSLRCLTEILVGTEEHHLGVLAQVTQAAELYGYTLLNLSLTGDGRIVCFGGRGIDEVIQYLRWCHSFFDQLGIVAAVLPEPFYTSSASLEAMAQSNAALLETLLKQLRDETGKIRDSERHARSLGRLDAMGTVSISQETFRALGKALASVIGGWFTPEQRLQFAQSVSAGCAELTELHDLVRTHVNDRAGRITGSESADGWGRTSVASHN